MTVEIKTGPTIRTNDTTILVLEGVKRGFDDRSTVIIPMRTVKTIEYRMLSEEECSYEDVEYGEMVTTILCESEQMYDCDKFTAFESNLEAIQYFKTLNKLK